jgi:hypothetical protein
LRERIFVTHPSYEWYLSANLDEYAGKWIAIIGERVVAHGTSHKEVLAEVLKNHPQQEPLITRVPVKGEILIL